MAMTALSRASAASARVTASAVTPTWSRISNRLHSLSGDRTLSVMGDLGARIVCDLEFDPERGGGPVSGARSYVRHQSDPPFIISWRSGRIGRIGQAKCPLSGVQRGAWRTRRSRAKFGCDAQN